MNAKRKLLLVVLAGAVVLAGGAFAWKSGKGSGNAAAVATAAKPGGRPIELIAAELHTIKPRGLVDVVRFTGTTQPIDQTIVKARVAGRLAEVLVREGDRVTKGQVLARFETNELQSRSTSASRRSTPPAPTRAGRRATSATRRRSPSATSSRSRPPMPARSTAENKASMVSVSEAQLEIAAEEPGRCRGEGAVRRRGRRAHRQPGRIAADRRQDPGPARHQPRRGRRPDAGGRRRAPQGRPARHGDAGRLRRSRLPGPHHPHQPDGAGRARARSRSMSRSATATTHCAAACSPWAPSSSPRRAMRSPFPPPPCARTTRATMCWPSRTACW